MTDKEEETTDLELPPSDSMDIALSVFVFTGRERIPRVNYPASAGWPTR